MCNSVEYVVIEFRISYYLLFIISHFVKKISFSVSCCCLLCSVLCLLRVALSFVVTQREFCCFYNIKIGVTLYMHYTKTKILLYSSIFIHSIDFLHTTNIFQYTMYTSGQNKSTVDDHGDDEYLSRKALQRYMHSKVLQEEEDDEDEELGAEGQDHVNVKDNVNGKSLDKNKNSNIQSNGNNNSSRKESTHQDFEHILRLDGTHNGDAETEGDAEGEDKLLSKLVDENKESDDDDELDDDDDDDLVTSTGTGLLESLTTDIEKYHKRVQLKKKFDNSSLEKKIAEDLNKSQDANASVSSSKKRDSSVLNPESNKLDEDSSDENYSKRGKTGSKRVTLWTKAEDDAIVYYKEEMKYSWKKIEELLEKQHSWQAIQMRYLRNHKSRNDEWSRFMEIRLINAIRKDWENRWKRISADLGKDFGPERCTTKNIEICKKMELSYFSNVFKNKDVTAGYKNQFNDIKDAEAHKKLMLVYMGLDSITYEDSDGEEKGESNTEVPPSSSLVAAAAAAAVAESATDKPVIKTDNTSSTEATATPAISSSNIDTNKPSESNDINKIIGMNMNIDVVNASDDIADNVDPAITGEGISKDS